MPNEGLDRFDKLNDTKIRKKLKIERNEKKTNTRKI